MISSKYPFFTQNNPHTRKGIDKAKLITEPWKILYEDMNLKIQQENNAI